LSDAVDCVHVIFRGDVQGVGFRYTTKRAAATYPGITGIVRNLPDGTVELLAEGTRTDLDHLLSDIRQIMTPYMRDMASQYSVASRIYTTFSIGL